MLQVAHPWVYFTAEEYVRVIGMIRLVKSHGTSWTVRIAKLRYREEFSSSSPIRTVRIP
jgi:hypothetical protein